MELSSELWKANHPRRSCSLPPGSWSSQKFSKQPVKLFQVQALVDKGNGCCGRSWEVKCLQGLRDLGGGSTFSKQVSDWHCRAINRVFSQALLGLFWSSHWMCKLNYILRQPLGKKISWKMLLLSSFAWEGFLWHTVLLCRVLAFPSQRGTLLLGPLPPSVCANDAGWVLLLRS